MTDEVKDSFKLLIEAVHLHAGPDFSGLGLILYDHLDELDYMKLFDHQDLTLPVKGWHNVLSVLLTISKGSHPFHDGFHAIDSSGNLTHVSLYLAPPISSHGNAEDQYGSRFHTARLTADIDGILATAVISKNYGIKQFS